MGGEHGHRGHADEQGEGQAVQGALHPCEATGGGPQLGCEVGRPQPSLTLRVQRSQGLIRGHSHSWLCHSGKVT